MSAPTAADTFLRRRREALSRDPARLGIDFVEVVTDPQDTAEKTLVLHFVPDAVASGKHAALATLEARHFRFTAGDVDVGGLFDIQDVRLAGTEPEASVPFRFAGDADLARRLGESPVFRLEIEGFPDIDPFFSGADFSLDLGVPPKLDCADSCPPPASQPSPPWIDYLVRDYDSFRRLMLDHLSRRLPDWRERSPADQLVTVVELLADAADQAAYAQDAVATEAYLGTARRRISVRRHARLVGYRMHEGTNARLWASFEVDPAATGGVALEPGRGTLTSFGTAVTGTGTAFTAELAVGQVITSDPFGAEPQTRRVTAVRSDAAITVDAPFDPPLAGVSYIRPGAQMLTRVPFLAPGRLAPESRDHDRALAAEPVVFETAEPALLWPEHNEIPVYAWGAESFALPAGATEATLVGRLRHLRAGDVLIFEQVLSEVTGEPGDADPRHRQAVRLISVAGGDDPLAGPELPTAPVGTGSLESLGTVVTGTGTAFTSELDVGDAITAAGQIRRITEITSDTQLTVDAAFLPDLTPPTVFTLGRLTEVTWHPEDALRSPLCVAAVVDGTPVTGATVARGNAVLADHGRTVGQNRRFLAGTVASSGTAVTGTGTAFTAELAVGDRVTASGQSRQVLAIASDTALSVDEPFAPELPAGTLAAHGELPEIFTATAGRFRPTLALPGLTHRVPFDPRTVADQAAGRALEQDLRRAVPALDLRDPAAVWSLARDLLASDRFARDFVVEMDNDASAVLRFGDGELGRPPTPGTRLAPVYRVGNGAAGNLGPEGLAHAVTAAAEVRAVRSLLAAAGGVDPEPQDDVRRAAPGSLLRLETCTTERDFVRLAEEHAEVERAAASLRWTGSWFRLVLAVERSGGLPVDAAFQSELAELFEGHRLAGWELEIGALRFVGLDIALTVLLRPEAVAGAVEKQLLEVFGNGELPDGSRSFFHPANLGFGRSVFLSHIVDTAMTVPGVEALDFDATPPKPNRFRRFGEPSRGELAAGQIRLTGLEMPRVDNDPAAPENGQIRFFLEGGR